MPRLSNIRWPKYKSSFVNEEKVFLSACWTRDLCKIAYSEVLPLLNKYFTALKCKTRVFLGSAVPDLVALVNSEQYLLGNPDIELLRKSAGTFLYGKESQ